MRPNGPSEKRRRLQAIQSHFLDRAQEDLRQLREFLEEGSDAAVARILHSLKGAAGSCGFPAISAAARALENTLLTEDLAVELLEGLAQTIADSAPKAATGCEAQLSGESGGPRKTVLCVEDDDDIALLIRCALESDEVAVEVCVDGRRGWERLLHAPRPDVILLDLMLPEINGLDLLGRIRSRSELDGVGVIVLSARALGDYRERAILAGADACLLKPFDLSELQTLVRGIE